jgi:hypothetical protein
MFVSPPICGHRRRQPRQPKVQRNTVNFEFRETQSYVNSSAQLAECTETCTENIYSAGNYMPCIYFDNHARRTYSSNINVMPALLVCLCFVWVARLAVVVCPVWSCFHGGIVVLYGFSVGSPANEPVNSLLLF